MDLLVDTNSRNSWVSWVRKPVIRGSFIQTNARLLECKWNISRSEAGMTRRGVVTTTSAQLPAVTPPLIGSSGTGRGPRPALRPPHHATNNYQTNSYSCSLPRPLLSLIVLCSVCARISRNLIEMCSLLNTIRVFGAWNTWITLWWTRSYKRSGVAQLCQLTDGSVFLSFLFHRCFDTGLPFPCAPDSVVLLLVCRQTNMLASDLSAWWSEAWCSVNHSVVS